MPGQEEARRGAASREALDGLREVVQIKFQTIESDLADLEESQSKFQDKASQEHRRLHGRIDETRDVLLAKIEEVRQAVAAERKDENQMTTEIRKTKITAVWGFAAAVIVALLGAAVAIITTLPTTP